MPDKIESHPADEPPSKSQVKRDMLALSELGAQLVELPPASLKKLPLPDQLDAAIRECQAITRHGGRKRQLKFIGKVMRDVDADEIRLALEKLLAPQRADAQQFHLVEQWRDRLLEQGDPALAKFLDEYPEADRHQLRQQLRNARNEKLSEDKRKQATRELFRSLRSLLTN